MLCRYLRVIHSVLSPGKSRGYGSGKEESEPENITEFREELPEAVLVGEAKKRQEFYQACAAEDVTVAISTRERREHFPIFFSL